jgi:coenzyme F420-reducing hydrogenase gamma subunit
MKKITSKEHINETKRIQAYTCFGCSAKFKSKEVYAFEIYAKGKTKNILLCQKCLDNATQQEIDDSILEGFAIDSKELAFINKILYTPYKEKSWYKSVYGSGGKDGRK